MAEQLTRNEQVRGSNPLSGSIPLSALRRIGPGGVAAELAERRHAIERPLLTVLWGQEPIRFEHRSLFGGEGEGLLEIAPSIEVVDAFAQDRQ